jgi:hypothetical protein
MERKNSKNKKISVYLFLALSISGTPQAVHFREKIRMVDL